MFGYVKPFKPELKIRDFESYKAVYCGLCRRLGRSFGSFARLTLSYDFTFVSMLYAALRDDKPQFETCRCCVNKLKKVKMCTAFTGSGEDGQAFSADVAAIMIYYKLLDNIQDSGPLGRLKWRMLKPFAKSAWKKASAARLEIDAAVAECMERQRQVERDKGGVDAACDPSATAMAKIFMSLSEREDERRVLERMGYLLGRYVYLCDALDDLEKDKKSGNYNPFLQKFPCGDAAQRELLHDEAKRSLYLTAGELEKACDLLELRHFEPIIRNITSMGLRAGVEEILAKKEISTNDGPV